MREVAGGVDLWGRRTVGLTAAGRPAAIHLHAGRHRVRPVQLQRLTGYIARAVSRRRVYNLYKYSWRTLQSILEEIFNKDYFSHKTLGKRQLC
jgi:hypothetical protein